MSSSIEAYSNDSGPKTLNLGALVLHLSTLKVTLFQLNP